MKTGHRLFHRSVFSFALCSLLFIAVPVQSWAQTGTSAGRPMPSWTVLVLRLVSATHVEPTTGIVLSESGLVAIPLSFARPGDEIVVLDGGKDIIRHGRPAKTVQRLLEQGLAVIQVQGLSRQPPKIRIEPLVDDDEVRLAAFPPAEMISQGKLPLSSPGKVRRMTESGGMNFSSETPMPNVTGAILDECGFLAGFSSADGVQSLETDQHPTYLWNEELISGLAVIDIQLPAGDCSTAQAELAAPAEVDEPQPEPLPEPDIAVDEEKPVEEPAVDEIVDGEENNKTDEEEPTESSATEDSEEPVGNGTLIMEDGASETDIAADKDAGAGEVEGMPSWLIIVAILAAGLVTWLAVVNFRKREENGTEAASEGNAEPHSVVDDEPSTNVMHTPLAGADSVLVITAELTDGTTRSTSHGISSQAINLVIGRGGTDIVIDDHTISRKHASLTGNRDLLLISDMGSTNGTFINEIPCLEGETMYVQAGDTVIVGQVKLSIDIQGKEDTNPADESANGSGQPSGSDATGTPQND